MDQAELIALMRDSMLVTLKLAGPMLVVGLVVGVLVSLLQAVTKVHEATLSFIPKLMAVGVALALLAPFMMATLETYAHVLFDHIITIGTS
jgi:flagellar biosynthesis protein FliQ